MIIRYFICSICTIFSLGIINGQFGGIMGMKKTVEIQNINQGKAIYLSHCANCHGTTKGGVGPGLQKIRLYRTNDYLYRFITNPPKFISENAEANKSYRKYKSMMPLFPQMPMEVINLMLNYLDTLPYDSNNYIERRNWKKL
jgi:mono/diheme cytochrome c family protein